MISRRIKICILLLSVFILNGTNAQVIFEDYFTDGTASQWNGIRGSWEVINQEYIGYLDAPGPASDLYAKTGDMNWTNYIFQAQMKFVLAAPEWNDFGLVFYDQGNEYIRFTLGNEEAPPTARISYQKSDTSSDEFETIEELATVVSEPLMVSGVWYDVRLSIYNDCVYAYVNDILVARADNLPFTHGDIGLLADDATVYFDNIIVTNNTPVAAVTDIVQGTIRTNTKQITCNILPPEGYYAEQIDTDSIRLNDGTFLIHAKQVSVKRKQQMLVAKFSTSQLPLVSGDILNLSISGMLIDGTPFAGSDIVEVVSKGKPN